MPLLSKQSIQILARSSPLSRAQVLELGEAVPNLQLDPLWVESTGDKDKVTSLRSLEKTDFFTRELDAMLLEGRGRVAVHSAKDLPDPLPEGLKIIAITEGVDRSDSLVLRKGSSLESLAPGARIATSSARREEAVMELRGDLSFCDLRGHIGERLEVLDSGRVDGVVIAEAALIRLGLTHRNRVTLPGPTTPLQGQLALLAREDDDEMAELFRCLDTR